jgi:uncharacterized protein
VITPGWRECVESFIRAEAQPKDKFGHQPRLYALACRLGAGMEYDDDVLFAAAWMHDLGVFVGHRPDDPEQLARWDHVPYTVARTRELLKGWGFPLEKLAEVEEAIRTHQAKDEPEIAEAILLRDADILEQLGAIGILRAVVKVGRDTRYETFSSVIPVLRRALEDLPSQLRLSASKDLAGPRVEFIRLFITSIEEEAAGQLH